MKNFQRLFLIVFVLMMPILVFSQPKYTSTNKGAIKSYEEATKYYDSYDNDKAIISLEKAIDKDPEFIEAYILLANVYVDKGAYEKAIDQYQKSIQINPNFYPTSYYTLANI